MFFCGQAQDNRETTLLGTASLAGKISWIVGPRHYGGSDSGIYPVNNAAVFSAANS